MLKLTVEYDGNVKTIECEGAIFATVNDREECDLGIVGSLNQVEMVGMVNALRDQVTSTITEQKGHVCEACGECENGTN